MSVATASPHPSANHIAFTEDEYRSIELHSRHCISRHLRQTSASTRGYLGRTIRPATRLVGDSIDHEHNHEFWISSPSKLVRQYPLAAPSRLRNAAVEQRPIQAPNRRHPRPMEAHARHAPSLHRAADREGLCVLLCHVYVQMGTEWVHRNWGDNVQAYKRNQVSRSLCKYGRQLWTGGVLDR